MKVIGLMSGTSFDAVDAAAAELRLEGDAVLLHPLGGHTLPYADELRQAIAGALPPAGTTAGAIARLDSAIGQHFAEAARCVQRELCEDAELVVSHGQTLFHWVEEGAARGSLQLGEPAWIAEATGLPVVSDLRNRDIAAGGQGAPLVALFDALMLAGTDVTRAAVNLGGIANLTIVPPTGSPLAYDVGPGNALLDAAVAHLTNGAERFDRDGERAARGRVHEGLLDRLLRDPYYELDPPKSTGKEHFNLPYLLEELGGLGSIDGDDLLATLTALTATVVGRALVANGVSSAVVSGGGTANASLMARLRDAAREVVVETTEAWGIPSRYKEAYAFALLGFMTVHGLPGALPSCTGARTASVLGSVTPGRSPLELAAAQSAPARLRVVLGDEQVQRPA